MDQTKIILRDFTIQALLGIFEHEIARKQTIVINLEASLANPFIKSDQIEATVSYVPIIEEIRRISNIQFSLAEKFADHIADFCFCDPRLASVKIRVEKQDVFPEGSVGAEITRTRPPA